MKSTAVGSLASSRRGMPDTQKTIGTSSLTASENLILKIPLETGHVKHERRLENGQLHVCGVQVVGILGHCSLENNNNS